MTTSAADDIAVAQRRFRLVALAIPLLLAAVAVALQWWWLPDLPDPAATHFSGSAPDGFGPAWTYPAITAGLALVLLALTGVLGWQSARSGSWNSTLRLLGSFVAGMVVFLLVSLSWTVHAQRGLADAHDAPPPGWFLLAGAVIGCGYGLLAWFAQPSVHIAPDGVREARPHTVGAGDEVTWTQTVKPGATAQAVLGIALLLVFAAALAMTLWNDSVAATVVIWCTLAALILSAATLSVFRVRIDESGLTIRSLAGLPRWRIALPEITAARSLPVNPVGDFGGWGVRWQPGAGVGIVTRRGEALQVEYKSGKRLTITVDDSARASDLLLSLRDRDASSER